MSLKSPLLILLFLCVVILSICGQDDEGCYPSNVRNLKLENLTGNTTLSWDPPLDELCDILYYLVNITILQSGEQRLITVTERSLDVSLQGSCLRYRFEVSQVSSDNVTGLPRRIEALTSPPSDANLALDYVRVSLLEGNVKIEWALEDELVQCADTYNLAIRNEETDEVISQRFRFTSLIIVGLVPCTSYLFSVNAVFALDQEGPSFTVRQVTADSETTTPTVEAITVATTSVALTLGLEKFEENRCTIDSVNVDGGSYFNTTFPVRDQINRNHFPVNLTGLQPDTLYTLRISANNTSGFTDPLLLAVQTLDSD